MSKFKYGDLVAATDLIENDRFCKKINERISFRVTEISDKIYYVPSGYPNNAKQAGYKTLPKTKSIYYLTNKE